MTPDRAPLAIDPGSELALELRRAVESGERVRVVAGDTVYDLNVRVVSGGIERATGGWQGLIDFDAFLEDLYERRRMVGRPPVDLDR